ncbi:MAG: hypothetical protein AAGD92_10380 [Pseudomonadota bacterium]
MRIVRVAGAFAASVIIAYFFAAVFYTQRVLAKQAEIGALYTPAQQAETYITNLIGLWLYGAMIAIALLIAFLVAAGVKRVLKPLALVAYPIAGAAAIYVLLTLVEAQLGGGAGIIGGARTALGVGLQCLAGFLGGTAFAVLTRR